MAGPRHTRLYVLERIWRSSCSQSGAEAGRQPELPGARGLLVAPFPLCEGMQSRGWRLDTSLSPQARTRFAGCSLLFAQGGVQTSGWAPAWAFEVISKREPPLLHPQPRLRPPLRAPRNIRRCWSPHASCRWTPTSPSSSWPPSRCRHHGMQGARGMCTCGGGCGGVLCGGALAWEAGVGWGGQAALVRLSPTGACLPGCAVGRKWVRRCASLLPRCILAQPRLTIPCCNHGGGSSASSAPYVGRACSHLHPTRLTPGPACLMCRQRYKRVPHWDTTLTIFMVLQPKHAATWSECGPSCCASTCRGRGCAGCQTPGLCT